MKFFKCLFVFLLVLFSAAILNAQETRFLAEVDRNQVALDSYLHLTLTVFGAQSVSPLDITTQIKDFDVEYQGPSRRVSIINGQYEQSVAFNYNLYPKSTGTFTIPRFRLVINNIEMFTESIQIDVFERESSVQTSSVGVRLEDRVKLVLKVPEQNVFVGQRVPVKVLAYFSGLNIRNLEYPKLNAIDVEFEPFGKPTQGQDVISGVRYDVVEFSAYAYPLRSGMLTIGAAEMGFEIIFQDERGARSPFGRIDSFFDDDFLDGFFGAAQARHVLIKSDTANLSVEELPSEGKPQNFSGAVGTNFTFDVAVSPSKVKAGDPLTLQMTIAGNGGLQNVRFPEIVSSDDLKTYEPNIKSEGQKKICEQVVIPKSENVREFPSLDFWYFDTAQKQYRRIVAAAVPLEVTPLEESEKLKVVAFDQAASAKQTPVLGEDILFIKLSSDRWHRAERSAWKDPLFVSLVSVMLLVLAGLNGYGYSCRAKENNAHVIKYRKAYERAQKRFYRLGQLCSSNQKAEFYDELFGILQQYFCDRFGLRYGEVTVADLKKKFSDTAQLNEVYTDVKKIFEECDMARFALARIDQKQMTASLHSARQIIDRIERAGL